MKIIECQRCNAGIEKFIPTETKIHYINKLLKIGFDTIDFGSFVSEKSCSTNERYLESNRCIRSKRD